MKDPKDLYENADKRSKCKYSRIPCLKCELESCIEHSPRHYIAGERRKEMVKLWHKGMTALYISQYFSIREDTVCDILKVKLGRG
jgi:hypothetical protein